MTIECTTYPTALQRKTTEAYIIPEDTSLKALLYDQNSLRMNSITDTLISRSTLSHAFFSKENG